MKLSNVALLTAALSTANGAVVTVTEHAHKSAVVRVEGLVYVENGQTTTSFLTVGTETATDQASATPVTATASVSVGVDSTTTLIPTSEAENTVSVETESSSESETATSYSYVSYTSSSTSSASETVTSSSSPVASPTSSQAASSKTTSSSSSSAPSASSSSSASSDFASTVLNEHNNKRALHKDTPALSWSDELASYAQDYADKYDCSGTLTHSGGPYGENLALGYGAAGAVDAWYDEISSYDYSNPTFSSSTGHFTQVVWKSSTQVGCGIKTCGGVWGSYVICSYDPAGNVMGSFSDNVEPLA